MKLTLSYAGFIVVAGALVLAAGWVYLDRGHHVGLVFEPDYRLSVVRDFAPLAAVVMGFLVVFGLVGGWLLAGRMLAPLTRITEATRTAATGSLSHRIALPGRNDELRELADAFDAMLARLEAHVAEQQRFAANASHELRTPLAISQALLDVARNDPSRGHDELIERLHTVNARAIDLTEALLLLSRGDRLAFSRDPVDVSLLAEDAAETLLALAEERAITLEVTGDPARTHGSAPLLLRMVTNLIQNAVVHNLPDGGGTVSVRTSTQDRTSVLRVENTGPRVPAELVATLTEPFQRGTQRVRTDGHAGVGLGLAIVQSIVSAHDGTLHLEPRPGGGLVAEVRLPVSAAADRPGSPRGSARRTPDRPGPVRSP